jgi:MoaA/NifB/PqqE/SkfB family radical SAM enzyme
VPHNQPVNRLQAIQLAITNKCPMQCEHCCEWNNLNREETFTTDELKKIIDAIQQEGCTQIYFTGGEPMVRMSKLEELIRHASVFSDCWVLTSGHHLTPGNALRLKKAGARGVFVSLDHFEEKEHNRFRGSDYAYEEALLAVENANQVKLATAFSICLTRSFVTENNLMRYARLAKECGVSFVQLLEPRAVGHFEGKEVDLTREQLRLLDAFFLKVNYDPQYRDYPVFIYQGYQQRSVGCLSGGKFSMYIDAAGYIDACPFCHTHSFDAHDILSGRLTVDQIQMAGCPLNVVSHSPFFTEEFNTIPD